MTSHPAPVIPSELINMIVNEVAQDPDKVTRTRTLSSIALGSWALRHGAHKHLFATVDLFGTHLKSATPRIRQLHKLIDAEKHSESTGIASYIRSFSVYMVGPASMVRPTLDDGTMATIFRKIFKTEDIDGPRSLSLTLGTLGSTKKTFDWTTLNADFLSAFDLLCRNPLFTTLHLSKFINLPPSLLTHSLIKSVKFSQIRLLGTKVYEFTDAPTFVPSSDEEEAIVEDPTPFEDDQLVRLESIETDHSFPLLEVLDMTPRRSIRPQIIFSKLKNLTIQIQCEDDLDKTAAILIDAAPSLEQLEVNLGYHQATPVPIEYSQLPALKSLTVRHAFTSYKSPGRSMIPQICHILQQPYLPPSLQKIEISLLLHTERSDQTFTDIFDGHDYPMLDALFSHPRFFSLRYLTIRFMFNWYCDKNSNERKFRADAAAYVQRAFPDLNSVAESGPLIFDIVVEPYTRYV